MKRSRGRRGFVAALAACAFLAAAAPADALLGSISSFAPASSGNIAFTVADVTNAALPGSQSYSFNLTLNVGTVPATISLSAPAILGTQANTIPYGAYHATCTQTAGSLTLGAFASSGNVQLASTPVTCATISTLAFGSVTFAVSLFLDTRAAPYAFGADTYASAPLTVTVDAP